MIDFSTLHGIAIPEGQVTRIESGGRVLWQEYSKQLISFTIDGIHCEAEAGMTWVHWVNSSYNTTDVRLSNELVMYHSCIIQLNGVNCYVDGIIQEGANYVAYDPDGAGP